MGGNGEFFTKKSGYGWIWIWPDGVEWSRSQNFAPWRALRLSRYICHPDADERWHWSIDSQPINDINVNGTQLIICMGAPVRTSAATPRAATLSYESTQAAAARSSCFRRSCNAFRSTWRGSYRRYLTSQDICHPDADERWYGSIDSQPINVSIV